MRLTQAEIQQLHTEAKRIQSARVSRNTIEAYRYDWNAFTTWCQNAERPSFPATTETVVLYVTGLLLRGRKITTAERHLSSITHYHLAGGFATPCTDEAYRLLSLARRDRGGEPRRQMRPLTVEQLREISATLKADNTWLSVRDRAMLVLAFATALRRSNVATLQLDDVETCEHGLIVHLRKEKQDQEGKGRMIGLPFGKNPDTCAPTCIRDWLKVRGDRPGPLFPRVKRAEWHAIDGERLATILKRCISRIGLNPKDRWGAHSLRAGFITAAGESGAGELLIAHHTGHRSLHVLRQYFRRNELWRNNVAGMLAL